MPLCCQTNVGGDRFAAADPPVVPANAERTHDAPAIHGQIMGLGFPLMKLPTGLAAITLQPSPLLAAVLEVPRLLVAIFRGMPPSGDVGVVRQGDGPPLPSFSR